MKTMQTASQKSGFEILREALLREGCLKAEAKLAEAERYWDYKIYGESLQKIREVLVNLSPLLQEQNGEVEHLRGLVHIFLKDRYAEAIRNGFVDKERYFVELEKKED